MVGTGRSAIHCALVAYQQVGAIHCAPTGNGKMQLDFQQDYWEEQLLHPDWYIRLEDELRMLFFPVVHHDAQLKVFRNQVYELIARMVEEKRLPIAIDGPNLDGERKPVGSIVIHHTEEEPEISLGRLSAIGLIRQYAYQYLEDNVLGHRVRGRPIWSGHFREGKMVFFAYHWLVRPDGTAERLLEDAYIGWHAGNWEINTKSVGIALSGNYENAVPPLRQIEAIVQLMKERYPHVSGTNIIGHREVPGVRESVTCPGAYFLRGWKETLLQKLQE